MVTLDSFTLQVISLIICNMKEPINILSELVMSSANDVLAGLQSFDEHLDYLRQMNEEYAAKGVKLPLDLSEPDEHTNIERSLYFERDNHGEGFIPQNSYKQEESTRESESEPEKEIPGVGQGLLFGDYRY